MQLSVVPIRLLSSEVTALQSGPVNRAPVLLSARIVFCKATVPARFKMPPEPNVEKLPLMVLLRIVTVPNKFQMAPTVRPELPLRVLLVIVKIPALSMPPGPS